MGENNNGNSNYVIVSVLTGVGFLIVAILILYNKANITSELFFAMRLVLALGSGFISAGISGNIMIEVPEKGQNTMYYVERTAGIIVKAGGPIAITVLVWVYSPEVL